MSTSSVELFLVAHDYTPNPAIDTSNCEIPLKKGKISSLCSMAVPKVALPNSTPPKPYPTRTPTLAGDIIPVVEKVSNQWWLGKTTTGVGYFPQNHGKR